MAEIRKCLDCKKDFEILPYEARGAVGGFFCLPCIDKSKLKPKPKPKIVIGGFYLLEDGSICKVIKQAGAIFPPSKSKTQFVSLQEYNDKGSFVTGRYHSMEWLIDNIKCRVKPKRSEK